MSTYYKTKFSKLQSRKSVTVKGRGKLSNAGTLSLLKSFAEEEFGEVVASLPEEDRTEFYKALITVLHSHRYSKRDQLFDGLDYTIIRDVLYNYTTGSRHRFLALPYFALLFHHFVVHGRSQFLVSRAEGKPQLFATELEEELSTLDKEAERTLTAF